MDILNEIKKIKIHRCNKKYGMGKCSQIATYKVTTIKKDGSGEERTSFRCDKCRDLTTKTRKTNSFITLDQSNNVNLMNNLLSTLLNKTIYSSHHSSKNLVVKYVKKEVCGVMCQNKNTKRWKFVYPKQIKEILK